MRHLLNVCRVVLLLASRVHITEATLKHLNKAYEVEEGNGHLRDPYLKELNVQTYLVIDPRVSRLMDHIGLVEKVGGTRKVAHHSSLWNMRFNEKVTSGRSIVFYYICLFLIPNSASILFYCFEHVQ